MEYDLPVAQMARGDDIEGFYVLKSAFSKVANNGKPFLNLTLSDLELARSTRRCGTIPAPSARRTRARS